MSEVIMQSVSVMWEELRDSHGHLIARINRAEFLLEVRRNNQTEVFRLLDIFDWHKIENGAKDEP